MDKLRMQTANKADENFEYLAKRFPNAITETVDENGNVVRAIDKDILMQEIACKVVEGRDERYQFTWPEKKNAILLANAPINKTLRPCREESVDFDNTQNLYIEGDNLEVLKLLQETYLGKIDLIYIDPPYNTGNDFIYEDDFSQSLDSYLANSGQYDEVGNRLVVNQESSGRFHTDWLNMIYPRLKLCKDLLSDSGAIFISIDDNEVSNLQKICDEIFGECGFVSCISWQKVYSPKNNNVGMSSEVEYILCYSKNANWVANKLERTAKMNAMYKNPDNDSNGPWKSTDATAPGAITHQGMVYAIQNPFTGELIYPTNGCCWRKYQDDLLEIMNGWASYELKDLADEEKRAAVCGIDKSAVRKNVKGIVLSESLESAKSKAKEKYDSGNWPIFYYTSGGEGGIAKKTYLKDMDGRNATNFWPYSEAGHNDEAKKELASLFGGHAPFDTPKPVRLLERILELATNKDSIVLDFFSGSAVFAEATMKRNLKDGGNRKYILVQIPEKTNNPQFGTLCEIGKERIRRAGKKIVDDNPLLSNDLDIGVRVMKCDSSNMKDVYYAPSDIQVSIFDSLEDNIKDDRSPEDLLVQVMLELGVMLSSKIEKFTLDEKSVFSVENDYLIACFDKDVTESTITDIAKRKPYYFVMRDSSMANDSVATNFEQIFATYSPDTVRKVL